MAISRRKALKALGVAAVGTPMSLAAQGRCMLTFGTPGCNTTEVKPVFEPTGWKTTALDHITFRVADYQKEAAFYVALMGWTVRSDDGTRRWSPWGTGAPRSSSRRRRARFLHRQLVEEAAPSRSPSSSSRSRSRSIDGTP